MSNTLPEYTNFSDDIDRAKDDIDRAKDDIDRAKDDITNKGEKINEGDDLGSHNFVNEIAEKKAQQALEATKLLEDVVNNDVNIKEDVRNIGLSLGILGVDSIDDLCNHPGFREKVLTSFKQHELDEISHGNKRSIDRYLWDPLNRVLNIKNGIYNIFSTDQFLSPDTIYPDNELQTIDEHYFDFDASNSVERDKLQSLKKSFPNISFDDVIPLDIQYVALQAYKRYPELKGMQIHFQGMVDGFTVMPDKQHVMRSQVQVKSLFNEFAGITDISEREYVIQVNLLDREGVVTLQKLDQLSKGGVMSHELYHSLHYSTMSALKYAKFGLGFIGSPAWVREMERRTDLGSIARGTGHGLSEFRDGVHSGSTEEYTQYKKRTYLTSQEILYAILLYRNAYSDEIIEQTVKKLAAIHK